MAHFPMPNPTVTPIPSLTTFKSLSFDIYGTLIDWESSITSNFAPLVSLLPSSHPSKNATRAELASLFHDHEAPILKAHPTTKYSDLLAQSFLSVAKSWGLDPNSAEVLDLSRVFGSSVPSWKPFPDTIDAMQRLGKYYRLIPLSNVDRTSFTGTLLDSLKQVPFWRSYIAEDIGSYKPDINNFKYLLQHADADYRQEGGDGISKGEDLHVAQSLTHDHVPAKKMGMSSVWIMRRREGFGGGAVTDEEAMRMHEEGRLGYAWRFNTLGEFADEVERVWTAEGRGPRYA